MPPVVETKTEFNPVVGAIDKIQEISAQLKEIDAIVGITEEHYGVAALGSCIVAGAAKWAVVGAPFCGLDGGAMAAVAAVQWLGLLWPQERVEWIKINSKLEYYCQI